MTRAEVAALVSGQVVIALMRVGGNRRAIVDRVLPSGKVRVRLIPTHVAVDRRPWQLERP